jgi:hypothetical protein
MPRSVLPPPCSAPVNRAPVVTATDVALETGAVRSGASLVSAIDPEGRAVTHYAVWDADNAAGSGYWSLDGVALAAKTRQLLTAAEFARVEFHAGAFDADEVFGVAATDGRDWSGLTRFTVDTTPSNLAPTVSLDALTLARGTGVDAAFFVRATDPNGAADIARYILRDESGAANSGHWVVHGQAQAAQTDIIVKAADFSAVRWQAGTSTTGATDVITVTVLDKHGAAATASGTVVTAANAIPDLVASNAVVPVGGSLGLADVVTANDINGDAITLWALFDNTPGGGRLMIGDKEFGAGQYTQLSAADFANLRFVGGAAGDVDHLQIRAYDGLEWSDPWDTFTITTQAPLFSPDIF